jgi:hypothetical protein
MIEDLITGAEAAFEAPQKAPSRLKSRIFSKLMLLEHSTGPLRVLSQDRDAGESLCIFEHMVALLPSDELQSRNPCRVCHARVLAESFENPPIYWPGCPYVQFCKS